MADKIQWETEMEKALTLAGEGEKAVFLDFFNPE